MVNLIDKLAPRALLDTMETYTKWVGGTDRQAQGNAGRKILTKLGMQIAVNLLLVTGIFIAAAYLHRKATVAWPDFPGGDDGVKAVLWVAALIVSFPFLIAVWRKMEAGSMVIAEMSVNARSAGPGTGAFQSVISGVITVVGTGILILLLLLLSSTILPSINVLILGLAVVVVSGFLLYRVSVKFYAGAQFALNKTLSTPPDPAPSQQQTLPLLLRNARLETIELGAHASAAGKMISELRLRSETGASVVGIERNGEGIVNPSPNEELQTGDQLLLIGTAGQLAAAKMLLSVSDGKT